jgi:predicted permease
MSAIRRLVVRLRGAASLRRNNKDARMEQEFIEHIELQTADYIRAGFPPEEARRKAVLKFGPIEALKEEYREQRGMPMTERSFADLCRAFRTLAHEPGFTILTILMLGIGLAGAITIFSLVNGILLKPLPYKDPERLVTIRQIFPTLEHAYPSLPVDAYQFFEWKKLCPSIESMSLIDGKAVNVIGLGEPERVNGAAVSPNLFPMLGVDLALGRGFVEEEEQEIKSSVVILSDSFWHRKLNADPRAIGKTIQVNGRMYTIIGVLRSGFRHPDVLAAAIQTELFFPKSFDKTDLAAWQCNFRYEIIARLKPGVSHRQVIAELQTAQKRIEREAGRSLNLRPAIKPLTDAISGKVRRELQLLMVAVGILVLIVCVNLANLLLARGERRLNEFGIRAALGSSRLRLAMLTLAEAVILTAAGCAVALGLAAEVIKFLSSISSLNMPRLSEVSLDGRVVLFTIVLAALTSIVVGFLPAWRAGRSDPQTALRSSGRNIANSKKSRRTQSLLVACEVGLCLPLLVLAGLLVNSFVRLVKTDGGFTAPAVMSVKVQLAGEKYAEEAARGRFYRDLIEHLESMPGVVATAIGSRLPLQGESDIGHISVIPNARLETMTPANFRFVSADYLRTMGIPLLSGRTFSEKDRGQKVSIISARLSALLWPALNPIGRRYTRGGNQWFEVIGVAGDVRANLDKPPAPVMYCPYWDSMPYDSILVARTNGDPRSICGAMRTAIRAADPDVPIPVMYTMSEVLDERVVTRKFEMLLAGAFAIIALIVASLGIYAVVSYSVNRRTSEIGLRNALGAQARDIYRLILCQGLAPVIVGLLLGIPCALAGGRQLSSLLYEVHANDAFTITASVILLIIVAVGACWIPARRAARVDPMISLKYE